MHLMAYFGQSNLEQNVQRLWMLLRNKLIIKKKHMQVSHLKKMCNMLTAAKEVCFQNTQCGK